MKNKLVTLICVALTLFAFGGTACAQQNPDAGEIVLDAVLVRPIGLVATAVGGVFFVLTLPFAIPSHSVRRTERALVAAAAHATFVRPMGDLNALSDYDD